MNEETIPIRIKYGKFAQTVIIQIDEMPKEELPTENGRTKPKVVNLKIGKHNIKAEVRNWIGQNFLIQRDFEVKKDSKSFKIDKDLEEPKIDVEDDSSDTDEILSQNDMDNLDISDSELQKNQSSCFMKPFLCLSKNLMFFLTFWLTLLQFILSLFQFIFSLFPTCKKSKPKKQ
ncbi:hypothetical protein M0811_03255 [Anaeramoeba ignava]|uniref:Uncharacterized protein n=1 Tax=Anaeramoeba ignava TaxID=1746090 RepID=A0A9Q0R5C4_ANAIG|nr:hypothetical protein M0811_03255 [Anaeramoeba ignava]